MATPILFADAQVVTAKVKQLTNEKLRNALRTLGLPTSGVKAVLQGRLIDQINHHTRHNDAHGYNRIRDLVTSQEPLSSNPRQPATTAPAPIRPQNMMPNGYNAQPSAHMSSHANNSAAHVRPLFKPSPFYTIVESVTPVYTTEIREHTRDHIEFQVSLSPLVIDRLASDPSTKIMVYCASEPISPYTKVDIAFPNQMEVKVNGDEVKASLRGLKNKPGTTRPADITKMLRIKPVNYANTMHVVYALTNKKYYLTVNLVTQHQPEELVHRLKGGRSISREQVVREISSKADDADIVATGVTMSLKCPLSTLRISTPCRSSVCTHNQCFDATSFLQLQEQAPTWTCPVCNKAVTFEGLLVDQYVDNILRTTPQSVDQVTIEPNGQWSPVLPGEGSNQHRGSGQQDSDSDEEEDLVEIADPPRLASIKNEAAAFSPTAMTRTPPASSREQSIGSAPISSGAKRPISQVIDLVSSDDDEPVRGPKRQAMQTNIPGLGLYSAPRPTSASSFPNSESPSGSYNGSMPVRPLFPGFGSSSSLPHR